MKLVFRELNRNEKSFLMMDAHNDSIHVPDFPKMHVANEQGMLID